MTSTSKPPCPAGPFESPGATWLSARPWPTTTPVRDETFSSLVDEEKETAKEQILGKGLKGFKGLVRLFFVFFYFFIFIFFSGFGDFLGIPYDQFGWCLFLGDGS